jgi:hypothetical protein
MTLKVSFRCELLSQGKANVQAPWLGLTGFVRSLLCCRCPFHRRSGEGRFRPEEKQGMSHLTDIQAQFRVKRCALAFYAG